MADHDEPEIPAGAGGRGKQVFFLFMSAVVILVVVFLLGVSVGRGTRKPVPPADAGDAGDTTVAAPPAKTSPSDLNYHDTLQGSGSASDAGRAAKPTAATPPAPTLVAPPSTPPPTVSDAPVTTQAGKASPLPADHAPPATHGDYSLQVGAFSSMNAAQALLAQVKAKDKTYPAAAVTLPGTTPGKFRVLVGPFATIEETERMKSRLKKDGFAAIIKR